MGMKTYTLAGDETFFACTAALVKIQQFSCDPSYFYVQVFLDVLFSEPNLSDPWTNNLRQQLTALTGSVKKLLSAHREFLEKATGECRLFFW